MTKKIATLVATVAIAGALFAAPAMASPHYYHHDARWWANHHPRPAYAYNPRYAYGPGYSYGPMLHSAGWHWRLIGGHWRWVR
jgi:hypothetical protein